MGIYKAIAANKVQRKISSVALIAHIILCYPAIKYGWVDSNRFISIISLDALILACFGWWCTTMQADEIVEAIIEDERIPIPNSEG